MASSSEAKTKSTICENDQQAGSDKQHKFAIRKLSVQKNMDRTKGEAQCEKDTTQLEDATKQTYVMAHWESETASDMPWFHPNITSDASNTQNVRENNTGRSGTKAKCRTEVEIELDGPHEDGWNPAHEVSAWTLVGVGAVDLLGVGQQFAV